MEAFLKKVGSLRVTIVVVLLIAAMSVYGTFMKQEEALESVYQSPLFLGLLVVFGANLVACTVLRLRFRVSQAGFLATHLGVIVVLAGAIIGFVASEEGHIRLAEGETCNAYQARIPVDPMANYAEIKSAVEAAGGQVVSVAGNTATTLVPEANFNAFMHSLDSVVMEGAKEVEGTICIMFRLNAKKQEQKLPFTIRLDRFTVHYYSKDGYNYGDLVVTELEPVDDKLVKIGSMPATYGEAGAFKGYKVEIGEFLPNFVLDSHTRRATTRDENPGNPAISVTLTKEGADEGESFWVFANSPGFYEHMRRGREALPFRVYFGFRERVKSYKSDVTILDGESREVKSAAIEVNRPLSHEGYTIYQSSYDPENHKWTGLQVARDPSLWIVYIGFALLLGGVFFIFYAKPYIRRAGKTARAPGAEKPVVAAAPE